MRVLGLGVSGEGSRVRREWRGSWGYACVVRVLGLGVCGEDHRVWRVW